jgi:hypothetical protein
MARSFTAGSSELLECSTAVKTTVPVTICAWVNFAALPAAAMVIASLNNTSNVSRVALIIQGTGASSFIGAQTVNSSAGSVIGSSGSAPSTNTWTHVAAVFASNASRTAYINGVAGTTETTSRVLDTPTNTTIGARHGPTTTQYLTGSVAEVSFYNSALATVDIQRLADKVWTPTVKPNNLLCYTELFGINSPEVDRFGGSSFTVTGTSKVAHPPVVYIAKKTTVFFPAPAAPSFNPAWARNSNSLLQAA